MLGVAALFILALFSSALLRLPRWFFVSLFLCPFVYEIGIAARILSSGTFSNYMSLLVSLMGALITLYASAYFYDRKDYQKFYPAFLAFSGAMLGLCKADHLLWLFLFWELTSFCSFMLIAFHPEQEKSRKAALKALLITGAGGLGLLASCVLIEAVTGSWLISEIANRGPELSQSPHLPWILAGLLLAVFTKSAQFPFHSWLPGAMVAPTPVSAYLHSATMVKAGVFLLAKLSFLVFLDTPAAHFARTLVLILGSLTFFWGLLMATLKNDIKQILAWTTVSALGSMVFSIGVGGALGLKAFFCILSAHVFYKGALFLCVGNIDHELKSRNLNELRSLFTFLPFTSCAYLLASLSFMGLPIFFGFLAKEYLLESALALESGLGLLCTGFIFLGSILGFYLGARLLRILRPQDKLSTHKLPEGHEAPVTLLVGPLTLAFLGLAPFFFLSFFNLELLNPVIHDLSLHRFTDLQLKFWGGLKAPLILSGVAFGAGIFCYLLLRKFPSPNRDLAVNGQRFFLEGVSLLLRSAEKISKLFQTQKLSHYFFWVLGTWLALSFMSLPAGVLGYWNSSVSLPLSTPLLVAYLLCFGGLSGIVYKNSPAIVRVLCLGATGYGMGLVYLSFGAPDLALTQVSVESLSALLFVFSLNKIPSTPLSDSTKLFSFLRVGFSVGAGVLVFLILTIAPATQAPSQLRSFFETHSLTKANGLNVVNVILVDFRALDTLGEVTVLGIAALSIVALFKMVRKGEKGSGV